VQLYNCQSNKFSIFVRKTNKKIEIMENRRLEGNVQKVLETIDELVAEIEELEAKNEKFEGMLDDANDFIQELKEELEEARKDN